jgi:hypothetical protein
MVFIKKVRELEKALQYDNSLVEEKLIELLFELKYSVYTSEELRESLFKVIKEHRPNYVQKLYSKTLVK